MSTRKHIQVIIKWGQYEPGYWYGSADKKMVANIQLKKIGAHAGKYLCSYRILSGYGVEPSWYHLGYYDTLADAKRKVSSKIREASTPIGYRPPSGKRRSAPQRPRKGAKGHGAHPRAKRAARGKRRGHGGYELRVGKKHGRTVRVDVLKAGQTVISYDFGAQPGHSLRLWEISAPGRPSQGPGWFMGRKVALADARRAAARVLGAKRTSGRTKRPVASKLGALVSDINRLVK